MMTLARSVKRFVKKKKSVAIGSLGGSPYLGHDYREKREHKFLSE